MLESIHSANVNRKITVAFVVNDFLVGGMQRQFVEQLRFYDMAQFRIVLITLFSFPAAETLYAELPQDLEVYRLSFNGGSDLKSWIGLYALLKKVSPDVVVSSLFFSNTVARMLQPLLGYVSIAREHNTYSDKSRSHQFLDRVLASVSYKIVAVSETVATFTAEQERIPLKKFSVLHNGIDASKMEKIIAALPSRDALRREEKIPENSTVFLALSRLVPQKNIQLLIEGFAFFASKNTEAVLVIVGGGSCEEELRTVAHEAEKKNGIKERILFFGYRGDVATFYALADAVVSTSRIEGLSNVFLEGLAAGLPLIATKTAGTDELLEEGVNGFFIDDVTPVGVTSVLMKFTRANRASLSAEARRVVIERFDIRATVRAYEKLFKESLGTKEANDTMSDTI